MTVVSSLLHEYVRALRLLVQTHPDEEALLDLLDQFELKATIRVTDHPEPQQ